MTEPAEIRLDLTDVLAEIVLRAMAREFEMEEDDEETARVMVNAETRRTAKRPQG
ncbi:hypothetical protein [Paracraurococcus lichenis]|uniref:Uncharacterized protein n=1 Tax=Paracraurococcus lichenis TaxID=3064888 RepID=A0ABT9EEF3_9PROT|nr:hypothetical protein [Paracraurococcus sp. LOR1-02]MDO9714476.1 hypothetical protein [Paracraurococcus sp. LOR1-02]